MDKIHQKKRLVSAITIAAIVFCAAGILSAQTGEITVPNGDKAKVLGLINTRGTDNFTMTTLDGSSRYKIRMTESTSVRSNRKGVFRGATDYEATYLLRGLRVEVEGEGNEAGELVAKSVRFNETDLRTAQPLESRVDPVEQNATRMSGQIEESTALANRAQVTADEALASATRANTRINGLDQFDPVNTIVVPFATGSASLGPKGRAIIDEAAAWGPTRTSFTRSPRSRSIRSSGKNTAAACWSIRIRQKRSPRCYDLFRIAFRRRRGGAGIR